MQIRRESFLKYLKIYIKALRAKYHPPFVLWQEFNSDWNKVELHMHKKTIFLKRSFNGDFLYESQILLMSVTIHSTGPKKVGDVLMLRP